MPDEKAGAVEAPALFVSPRDWLTTLWGGDLPGYLVIWSLPSRKSTFHNTVDGAAAAIDELKDSANVFFGVGLQGQPCRGGRGKADTVVAVPGLWVDIDIAGEGHATTSNLFETEHEIQSFLNDLPNPPTVVVNSGGGIHAYWLFREPFLIESDEDRREIELLSIGWQGFLRDRTSNQIDSTHNIDRVLRVPGTWNRKTKNKRHCKVIKNEAWKYNASDFEMFKADAKKLRPNTSAIALDSFGEPPTIKLMAILENVPSFKKVWNRTAKFKDDSDSSYCLSIANTLVSADWSDQEIANTLAAWRTEKGISKQAKSEEWYRQTIAKARRDMDPTHLQKIAEGAIKSVAIAEAHPEKDASLLPGYSRTMQELSAELGIEIERIELISHRLTSGKLGSRQLVIHTPTGVMEQPAKTMLNQHQIRGAILDACLVVMNKIPGKKWDAMIKAIISAGIEIIEEAPEAADYGYLQDAIDIYLSQSRRTNDANEAKNGFVYDDGDAMWIHMTSFSRWIEKNYSEKPTTRELCRLMRDIGFIRKTLSVKGSSASLWRR